MDDSRSRLKRFSSNYRCSLRWQKGKRGIASPDFRRDRNDKKEGLAMTTRNKDCGGEILVGTY
jgi:hypothetical protein